MGRLAASWAAQRALLSTTAGRLLAAALALLGIATAVAMIALWPSDRHDLDSANGIIVASRDVIPATVTVVRGAVCPVESRPGCERVEFRLDGGLHPGRSSYLMLPGDEASPRPSPGDQIRVTPNAESFGNVPAEAIAGADPSQAPYGWVDYERRSSLLWLAVAFACFVVALGRWVGAVSLIGAGLGLLLVTGFIAPAILDGSSPFLVALIGSFAAMFLAIVPLYGLSAKSLASLLGTAVSLLLIAGLAVMFVHAGTSRRRRRHRARSLGHRCGCVRGGRPRDGPAQRPAPRGGQRRRRPRDGDRREVLGKSLEGFEQRQTAP